MVERRVTEHRVYWESAWLAVLSSSEESRYQIHTHCSSEISPYMSSSQSEEWRLTRYTYKTVKNMQIFVRILRLQCRINRPFYIHKYCLKKYSFLDDNRNEEFSWNSIHETPQPAPHQCHTCIYYVHLKCWNFYRKITKTNITIANHQTTKILQIL